MNDGDCCTEAREILTDVWAWSSHGGDFPRDRIGAFLVANGIIKENPWRKLEVDVDPPDEYNRNLEGEDL